MKFLTATILLLSSLLTHAGVYGDLKFGDSRETVTRKLKTSPLVEQTIDSTFMGRMGLNGVFKCKAKLAGLTYHLHFDWTPQGGLSEITLRSEEIDASLYHTTLRNAWQQASTLLTRAYNDPAQDGQYPAKSDFKKHSIMASHIWHRGKKQSILMGPGLIKGKKEKCFLIIRYLSQYIEPIRTP